MSFLMFLLCFFNVWATPDDSMIVYGTQYENIYVMPPVVKQDGKDVTKYDYGPLVISVMTLHRGFARNYHIDGIFSEANISQMGDCNYKQRPFECSNENDHWILMTDIQITDDQAYISLTLFDQNSMPISASVVSKKLRRKIIPRKKRTVNQTPMGIGMRGQSRTFCKSKEDCSQQSSGIIAGRSATTVQTEDLPPTIINFPAIIRNNDVRQAAMLLYTSLR